MKEFKVYRNLIALKIKEQIDNVDNSFDFWESLQKFRQENNLDEEGIEPDEWLQNVRDCSSGRETSLQKTEKFYYPQK